MKKKIFIVFSLFLCTYYGCNQKKSIQKEENKERIESVEEAFTRIYDTAEWGVNSEGQGFSGPGSLIDNARPYVDFLEDFLQNAGITSVVDMGCGDWELSRHVHWGLIEYMGIDVVPSVIAKNAQRFGRDHIHFMCANGAEVDLPPADLFICKDVLQHLPHKEILAICKQLSKYKYCVITNDVNIGTLLGNNEDLQGPGGYRTLDLRRPPFNLNAQHVFTYLAHDNNLKQVILIEN